MIILIFSSHFKGITGLRFHFDENCTDSIFQSRNAVELGADIVEIRVDLLDDIEQSQWHEILGQVTVPVIVTNRASWEGGHSKLSETDRLSILVDAVRRGVSHVDVELKAVEVFKLLCQQEGVPFPLEQTKLVLSHHDFEAALSDAQVSALVQKMRDSGASVCKIAMTATSALDNATVIRGLQAHSEGGPCIILAMGEYGSPSRILAGRYGGYLTFASLSKETGSAPGQVDLSMLHSTYRFREIGSKTPLYAVLGEPVSQSLSPNLFNACFKQLSIDATYIHMRVEGGMYDKFVTEIIKYGFRGFSVTIPGKLNVMGAMDNVDPIAKQIGAMNTVVRRTDDAGNDSLTGYNTDWSAAMDAIIDAIVSKGDATGLQGKCVASIGAGGAGRGLAFGVLEKGASRVCIVNRSIDKAKSLANELGERASAMSLDQFNEQGVEGGVDVIMNNTSVGMTPNTGVSPVVAEQIPRNGVVFDAIYNPMETELLRLAKERGCLTVSGLEMFVRQAAQQFEHWFPGTDAPIELIRQVVLQKLQEKQNS